MAVSVKPTRLQLDASATSAAASWVTVAEVIDLAGPNPSRDEVDVTAISSTSGYRSFIHSGFIDAGEITFSVNYNPKDATHVSTGSTGSGLTGMLASGSTKNWRIQLAGSSSGQFISFPAYVQTFNPSFSVGEQVRADITLRVTGAVTWPTT